MKNCPACNRSYADDGMSFCLDDGTALLSDNPSLADPGATIKIPAARLTNQAPTEVLAGAAAAPSARSPQTTQRYDTPAVVAAEPRKQNALPWILGAAVVLGLSAIAVAWLATRGNTSDKSQSEQIAVQSENSTPATESYGDPAADKSEKTVEAAPPRTSQDRIGDGVGGPAEGPGSIRIPTTVPVPDASPMPTPIRPRAPISGGIVNGKAISKPAPAYPAIAKAARASGTVTVQVTIDESGKVISAQAVGGHPLLQQAAVQAARQARFSPTLLSGQPVKVTGILTYNFVLP